MAKLIRNHQPASLASPFFSLMAWFQGDQLKRGFLPETLSIPDGNKWKIAVKSSQIAEIIDEFITFLRLFS